MALICAAVRKTCSESNFSSRASRAHKAALSKTVARSEEAAVVPPERAVVSAAWEKADAKMKVKSKAVVVRIVSGLDPIGHGQYVQIRTVFPHEL